MTSSPAAIDLGEILPVGQAYRAEASPGASTDIDGDGVPDSADGDADGDGVNNVSDPDADGNGVPDALEEAGGPPPEAPDTDGDRVPDIRDVDIDDDGVENTRDPDFDGDGKRDGAREVVRLAVRAVEGRELAGARELFRKACLLAPGDGFNRLGFALARLAALLAQRDFEPRPGFVQMLRLCAARHGLYALTSELRDWQLDREPRPGARRVPGDAFVGALLVEARESLAELDSIPAGFSTRVSFGGMTRCVNWNTVLVARGAVAILEGACLSIQASRGEEALRGRASAALQRGIDAWLEALVSMEAGNDHGTAQLLVLDGGDGSLERWRGALTAWRQALTAPDGLGSGGPESGAGGGSPGTSVARRESAIRVLSSSVAPASVELSRPPSGKLRLSLRLEDAGEPVAIAAAFANAHFEGRPVVRFARLRETERTSGSPAVVRFEADLPIEWALLPKAGTVRFTFHVVTTDGKPRQVPGGVDLLVRL